MIPVRLPCIWVTRLAMGAVFLSATSIASAQLTIVSTKSFPGKIRKFTANSITVESDKGDRTISYTKPGETTVPLPRAGVNLRHTTTIEVTGTIPASELAEGQTIRFKTLLNRTGKTKSSVDQLSMVSGLEGAFTITPQRNPANSREFVECEVIAKIASIRRQTMTLVLTKQEFAPTGKLRIKLDDSAIVNVKEKSLDRCQAGDRVKVLSVMELDSGDLVAEKIVVELKRKESTVAKSKSSRRNGKNVILFDPKNYLKYSDDPSPPRFLRTSHFLLHTDLSERSAKLLLDKLENMIALISTYYGRLPKGIIKCIVVRDLKQWKDIPLEPDGVFKIQQNAGVTISKQLGKNREAIVYSCDDHGVVQHEAVHAYCSQTFGSTGPTWYSEGMAEMGQYWKKGNLAVDIPPPVIRYLTSAPPKKLKDIVAAGQITGDSWQAYAWRWALCHLLAHNTNYSGRFKGLGMNMMSRGNATFETVYGDVAKEISFEYDQFVKNFGNGYRVDLCQWDWATKPVAISGQRRINCKIDSTRGWQASKLKLNQGKKYEYVCVGEWKISNDAKATNGDGEEKGDGKLVGVIFSNYQLGKVIELGQKGTFVAPADGHLFLRCREDFTKLSDNKGIMTVHFRRAID